MSRDKRASSGDFSTQGRAFLRVAGRRTGENRWVRAFYRAGDVTIRHTAHVAHALWLEVTGFLFLVLAVVGGGATAREYRHYSQGSTGFVKVAVAAVFTLLFLYFGVDSFRRSRTKTRK